MADQKMAAAREITAAFARRMAAARGQDCIDKIKKGDVSAARVTARIAARWADL